ncbi:hypothetical protein DL96DRAFT_1667614 [Flagelloscypha sp. PMI_526]|nr:hypothetical protein DL96DRAFT_1667614 [Flagelloscypha sp. PMI_526]
MEPSPRLRAYSCKSQRLNFATEELAVRWGETVGGFLCALLGNIVEIVVAGIALFKCELRLVQSSLIGSILSNLLLVLGTSFVVGAIYFKEQGFSLNAAQINSSLLFLGVCAITLPLVAYSYGTSLSNLSHLIMQSSRISSVCILALYLLGMNFQLRTHRTFVKNLSQRSQASEIPPKEDSEEPQVNAVSLYALLVAIAIKGITSHNPAITKEFIGLVLLPIVGNAAEHFTAITLALHVQIACFAIPLIVIVAWIGDKPLTLLFDPLETTVTVLAVILVNYVLQDGKANYLEGGILITLYALVVVYSLNYAGEFGDFYYAFLMPTRSFAGIDLESNLFACG